MTAINIYLQPSHNCLHVVSDGASYNADGIVTGFASKVFTQPQWPGIVAARGSVTGHNLVAEALASRFQTFESLVAGVEKFYREIAHDLGLTDRNLQLICAGWSRERDRPEAFYINSSAALPLGVSEKQIAEMEASGADARPVAFVRKTIPSVMEAPALSAEIRSRAGCFGIDVAEPPKNCILAMRLAIECQRHDVIEGVNKHFIGGFAQLTTIAPEGISQRIIARWPEDKIGQLITPNPDQLAIVAWKIET